MSDEPFVSLYRRFRPGRFDELRGQPHVVLALQERRPRRAGGPRLPVQRAPGDGEDVDRADPGQGPQLRRSPRRGALRRLLLLRGDRPRLLARRPRARRRLQQRRRRHARAHRPRRARHPGTLEGLHRRRGPHALQRGGQRPVEDLGGAARPRGLRAGHHRPAEGAGHHPEPNPALRVPASRGDTLAELVHDVSEAAGLSLDDAALAVAVRRGRGSARDALSALDQVAASGSAEDARPELDEVVESLAEEDAGRALVAVAALHEAGWSPQQLATELVDDLRQAFLVALAPELATADGPRQLSPQVERLGLPRLVRSMEVLGRAQVDMREAPDQRVVLEVALVRLARPELDDSTAALGDRLSRLERGAGGRRAGRSRNRPPPPGRQRTCGPSPPSGPCGGSGPRRRRHRESPAPVEMDRRPAPGSGPHRGGGSGSGPHGGGGSGSGARPARGPARARPTGAGVGRPRPAQPAGPGQGALQRRPVPVGGGRGGGLRPAQHRPLRPLPGGASGGGGGALGPLRGPRSRCAWWWKDRRRRAQGHGLEPGRTATTSTPPTRATGSRWPRRGCWKPSRVPRRC